MGLTEQLQKYAASDMYPFHMPGHKRHGFKESGSYVFPDPYSVDITEISGFDNLHHAEGILKEAMEQAAKVYGSDKTYYLVNGSSCGVLSAIFAVTKCGGKLLLSRNCHLSAHHAVLLNRLEPEYVYPDCMDFFGISGEVRVDEIERILLENREKAKRGEDKRIEAVCIVSPTYEGMVSDVKRIAKVVHTFEIPLLVDEAHGAHLPFALRDGFFPESALSQGADIVVQSLHKTLPSFTQTALLHVQGELIEPGKIERYLRMFQSSSPSYVFMAGMELCIRYMDREGRDKMHQYEKRLFRFYKKMRQLKTLKVLEGGQKDPSKVVIATQMAKGLNGAILGKILRERFHLEVEFCAPEYVLAMTSLMDTDEGFLRLEEALLAIDQELEDCGRDGDIKKILSCDIPPARQMISPAIALEEKEACVPLEASEGRISKEFVFLYPPGIPILTPGEQISKEILSHIVSWREAGLPVQGLTDSKLSTILTVACDG
ncbi:MAG: decarboxylase [Lachnospiraceae bacterium]|nr:decarboxylase [Lachnospiraceae bacterium]